MLRSSLALAASLTSACYPTYDLNYPVGHVPERVDVIRGLNTPFDDFNAAAPPFLLTHFDLALSSNRDDPRAGHRIHRFGVNLHFSRWKGTFEAASVAGGRLALAHDAEQFGPLYVWRGLPPHRSTSMPPDLHQRDVAVLFAGRSARGDLDLYVSDWFPYRAPPYGVTLGVRLLSKLSAPGSDEAYVTFGPDGRVYLASNRGGTLDIHAAVGGPGREASSEAWLEWLTSPGEAPLELSPAFSTPTSDDTALSILDDAAVFASNRPGRGGFDLYQSSWTGSGWAAPAPIDAVNTPSNEFRPTLIGMDAPSLARAGGATEDRRPARYDNHLLLFSSDRPGGIGGYDVYFVGLRAEGVRLAQ